MVDQNVIETTMRIEADAAAAKKTEARVKKVISGLETLQKTQTDPAAIAVTEKQIKLYEEEGLEIVRNTELLEEQTKVQAQQNKILEKRVKERKAKAGAVAGEAEFSDVTKRVALLGDAESNINAIGGAIGTLGGEAGRAVEGVLRIGAELFATAEAAPRLVASLKGTPAALKAAALTTLGLQTATEASAAASVAATTAEVAQTTATTALAPASVAAAGGISAMLIPLAPFIAAAAAAAAAVGVMAFAIHAATKASNEHADAIDEQRQANNTYIESLGMTTEEIQAQIDANNQALGDIDLKKTFEEGVIAAEKSAGVLETVNGQIGDALGITGAAGDQASESLEELTDQEKQLIADNEALTRSLESEEVAANDATKANEQVATSSEETASAATTMSTKLDEATQAEDELAQASEDLAKDLEASAKKTASAKNAESKAQADLSKAIAKSANEASKLRNEQKEDLIKIEQEQAEEITEARQDAHDEALKAQDDFGKSIRDKVKNQSFLAAIDEQDDFVEGQAEGRVEQAKKIADLRADNAEERNEKLEAQAEQRADAAESAAASLESSRESLSDASKLRAEAEREELMLVKQGERDKVELIRNRVQAETQLYQTVLTNFGQFASQMRQQANQLLSGSQSGNVNGSNALGGITTKQLQGIIG